VRVDQEDQGGCQESSQILSKPIYRNLEDKTDQSFALGQEFIFDVFLKAEW
jgi:hypothetical protein